MASFGQLLRHHRRQCSDPQRGGPLTQERLGELLGVALGDAGYTGAAVSEWERDKSKIDEDNRPVLLGLIGVLHRYGGLASPVEANSLLHAGNYRGLDAAEHGRLFPGQKVNSESEPELTTAREPASQAISKERRKQLILLEKVRSFWVEGVLEKSASGEDGIRPHFRAANESVTRPWEGIVAAVVAEQQLDGQESPLALYEQGDRSLLILGEPGAGKTMMLLALADALIRQATRDSSRPIPVVLNLVTWAKSRRSLEEWAVEELAAKYMIPRRISRQWLADNDLVLLLDGFDDVPRRLRRRCVMTINAFRSSHGLCGIVVCSRSKEYAATGVKLKIGLAVELRPLSDGQIDNYLTVQSAELEALRVAVDRDAALRKMASNPLMLSIMSLAYGDSQAALPGRSAGTNLGTPASLVTRRERLFDTYVSSMFRRRVKGPRYAQEQMIIWLAWLANQMYRFQQAPMLVEQIQPSWLAGRRWRWLYMVVSGLIAGLFTAVILWLLLQILQLPTPQLVSTTTESVAAVTGLRQPWAEAATLILVNLFLGLVFAWLQGNYFENVRILQEDPEVDSWRYRRQLALVMLVIGGLVFVIGSVYDKPQFALAWATAEMFVFGIITRYVFGVSYNSEIRTVESLGWSWPAALRGLVIGLAAATAFEILAFLILAKSSPSLSMIIPAAGGMVLGGIRGRRVEAKSRPNQGIVLSLRNSFVAASLSAAVIFGLSLYVRADTVYRFEYALWAGLLTFAVAGALFGGGNVIKHYLLRLLLWLSGELPWNVIRFLDDSADLVFLRKVGGGYIFIHRLLQQYFASLYQADAGRDADEYALAADRRQTASGGGSSQTSG